MCSLGPPFPTSLFVCQAFRCPAAAQHAMAPAPRPPMPILATGLARVFPFSMKMQKYSLGFLSKGIPTPQEQLLNGYGL